MKFQNSFPNPFARLIWFFASFAANAPCRQSKSAKGRRTAPARKDRPQENPELTIEILMRPF